MIFTNPMGGKVMGGGPFLENFEAGTSGKLTLQHFADCEDRERIGREVLPKIGGRFHFFGL
jgi:hypothetical protein